MIILAISEELNPADFFEVPQTCIIGHFWIVYLLNEHNGYSKFSLVSQESFNISDIESKLQRIDYIGVDRRCDTFN